MSLGSWLTTFGLVFTASAQAQLAASEAYPINTASPAPPLMHFDQKDRAVDVEIIVGPDGHTVTTKLLTSSGSGIYDERVKPGEGYHFRAEIEQRDPGVMAARVQRMTCGDLLWEYDFMRAIAPKAKLHHEQVFHVAFAMLIAARQLGPEARDSLIAQWDTLIGQTLDSCRAQPAARYWKEAFVHTFESATPVGVQVQ